MRAHEFITEQVSGTSLQVGAARALPSAYVIPGLPNQNPYIQYRFGVAMAAAGPKRAQDPDVEKFHKFNAWGDGMIVVNYDESETQMMDQAIKEMGVGPADAISTKSSNEAPDVGSSSPVRKFTGVLGK